MGQLDGDRARDDPRVVRVAELRREQYQGGAEPLAARIDQMPGGVGEQDVLGARDILQRLLNLGQALVDVSAQGGIG